MHMWIIDLRLCLRSEEPKLTDLSLFLGSVISSVLPFAPNTVRKILVSVPAY